jgi:hypothetical protein
MMQKAGNLQSMLKKGPFGGGAEAEAQLREGEKKLSRYAAYVEQMEADEREDPLLLIEESKAVRGGAQPVRLKRLATASDRYMTERPCAPDRCAMRSLPTVYPPADAHAHLWQHDRGGRPLRHRVCLATQGCGSLCTGR